MNTQKLFNWLIMISLMLLILALYKPVPVWALPNPIGLTRPDTARTITNTVSLQPAAVQPTWIELAPIGSPPDPIYSGKPVYYDATNNRLIAFFPGHPPYNPNPPGNGNEVWILTNANGLGGAPGWSKLQPTGTPPGSNALESVAYDVAGNRLIVYGGCSATCSPALAEVFVLTHANGLGGIPNWSQLTVTNPQARESHSVVYDSDSNRLIAFGGGTAWAGTDHNDTRILSNGNGISSPSTWTTLSTSGGPPSRRIGHSAIYDQVNKRMTIFGGSDYTSNPTEYNDVWTLSNANGLNGTPTWTQLTPSGSLPLPRKLHSAVYDSANNRMIVFGGVDQSDTSPYFNYLGDLWQLSNANGLGGTPTWTQLSPSGTPPGPRFYHTAAFDVANQRMIVLGGRDETDTPSNRVWVLVLPTSTIYLPIIFKPEPLTYLFVQSINTGGINPLEIRDPNDGNKLLLSCVIGNNITQYCGSFKAVGTYKVIAYTVKCGSSEKGFNDALPGATVTRSVSCD